MSGHSKWAGIKHKKAMVDAKRGKLFSKLNKEIMVAAKQGGGDPSTNSRLRHAIQAAKDANMPNENIERAIKRGTGELPGVQYEELRFEGYGPGGVAIMVEALSDNRNRASADIRKIFARGGGNLAGAGSVAWQFKKRGIIMVDQDKAAEDELMDLSLETGAEDLKLDGNSFIITSSPESFEKVRKAFKEKGVELSYAKSIMTPQSTVRIEGKEAEQLLKLMEALEDYDDVQNVYANFDIPDEILAKVSGE